MMNFDGFLEELEDSEFKKEFIKENKEEEDEDEYKPVIFKLSFSLIEKEHYVQEDDEKEDSVYTSERYDEVFNQWFGDDDYGELIDKFIEHYGMRVCSYSDVECDYDLEGNIIGFNFYWDEVECDEYSYNDIVQVLKKFNKDFNVYDYSVDSDSFRVGFYENKNDEFDTSIFNNCFSIHCWISG